MVKYLSFMLFFIVIFSVICSVYVAKKFVYETLLVLCDIYPMKQLAPRGLLLHLCNLEFMRLRVWLIGTVGFVA